MRTLSVSVTAAILAAATLLGAQSAAAMDHPAKESRAKIERALGKLDGAMAKPQARNGDIAVSTTVKKALPQDRYQRAYDRLFGTRSEPRGR